MYRHIVADSTVKEYMCPNGHKSVVKRYGKTIDMGKHKVIVPDEHTPNYDEGVRGKSVNSPAYGSKAKEWSRHVHGKTTTTKKVST